MTKEQTKPGVLWHVRVPDEPTISVNADYYGVADGALIFELEGKPAAVFRDWVWCEKQIQPHQGSPS